MFVSTLVRRNSEKVKHRPYGPCSAAVAYNITHLLEVVTFLVRRIIVII